MKTVVPPIPFAGLQLGENRHVCAFVTSDHKAFRVLFPNIARTHPMVIIGGLLQRNPFHVPPEEFLHELRERRVAQTKSASTMG